MAMLNESDFEPCFGDYSERESYARWRRYRGPHRDDRARRQTPWVLQAMRLRAWGPFTGTKWVRR